MRYDADLAARTQAWLALPTEQKRGGDGSGLLELGAIWAAIQGLPTAPACRQCQYSDRVHDLTAYLREYARFTSPSSVMATADTPQATYQFKPDYAGQTLTADDYGKAVTADNLTDEDAEHFIKRGFGHVFQKIGAAVEAVSKKPEGVGNGMTEDENDDQPTEREQELQAEVDEANQKLADQTTSYNAAYGQVKEALASEQDAHTTTTAALASEKQAHEATKNQLSEVQRQLAEAHETIADLNAKLAKKKQPAPAAAEGGNTAN